MEITTFLNTELVNYASYDNLRKIASCIDGLKNASRKVLYTIHEKKIKEKVKVSQLSAKCAEYSDYLHGDTLWNVIVTLGKDYAGTNNVPLIKKFGNFGTRCINESSAPRYIFGCGSSDFFNIFKYEDDPVLEQQYFEGNRIEPRFYVPTLPMLLVNGSEGVSSGFAQKILPRDPIELKKYILEKLNGKPPKISHLTPYIRGYNTTLHESTETPGKWLIYGKIEHIKRYEYLITEIPFTYDLKSYINVLEESQEHGIITKWENCSDGENVLQFKVWISKGINDNELLDKLKLIKSVTENCTCIDENNKIKEFKTVKDVIDHYIDIKLLYLEKRKEYNLALFSETIEILKNKIRFLQLYIDGTITIIKVENAKVIEQLERLNFLKHDNSYSYLLNMSIQSLTHEKLNELKKEFDLWNSKMNELKGLTAGKIWIDELKELSV